VALTVVALAGQKAPIVFMEAFGVIYLLTGIIGFLATGIEGDGYLLGLVHLYAMDNLLHMGLGVVIGAAGWVLSRCVGFRGAFDGDKPELNQAARWSRRTGRSVALQRRRSRRQGVSDVQET
jgi:hypothetical protein